MPPRARLNRIVAPDYPGAFLDWRNGSGSTVEIFDIHVPGEFRRFGIGRAMVNTLLEQVPIGTRLVWAITRTENRIAHDFYRAMGFRIVAPLVGFYRDTEAASGVDALLFGRDIP